MPNSVLILASSARFLAEAAANAGFGVATVDAFVDDDTRAVAVECRLVALGVGGLDAAGVEAELARPCKLPGEFAVVAGPGLDGHAGLFGCVRGGRFYGNAPEVFACCADPVLFAAVLDELGVARPASRGDGAFVTKTPGASGGAHVRIHANAGADVRPDACASAYLPGPAVSCLFLADGRAIEVVGFNTLWPSAHAEGFCYGGAVNRAPLSDAQRAHLRDAAERLTAHFKLRGVNSLDGVLCNGRVYCVELNPRPSATMQLYEADAPGALFRAHLNACCGELSPPAPNDTVRAHATLYALRERTLSAGDCSRPDIRDASAGRRVAVGEPLCSAAAEGATVAATLDALQSTVRRIQTEPRAA